MRKALTIVAIVAAGLVVLAACLALLASAMSERKRQRAIDVAVTPVAYAADDSARARGKYLFESRGCAECHGADGHGIVVIDSGGLYVKSPNISPGAGSVVKSYTEADWVRTIRHGVKPDKHPVIIMPSKDYNRLTDADLAALVAYVRSLPPVAGEGATIRFPLIVRALYAAGEIKDDAEDIDHTLPPSAPVPDAVTKEHGAYVATMCQGCHGDHFSGGPIPGTPPEWPPAANLTPGAGSAMPRYDSPEKFVTMLRTGKRPDATAVSKVMPFESLKNLSDTDVAAVYMFLKSLPPRAAGGR
jgi:mono/diheme cytochrome c family protein